MAASPANTLLEPHPLHDELVITRSAVKLLLVCTPHTDLHPDHVCSATTSLLASSVGVQPPTLHFFGYACSVRLAEGVVRSPGRRRHCGSSAERDIQLYVFELLVLLQHVSHCQLMAVRQQCWDQPCAC